MKPFISLFFATILLTNASFSQDLPVLVIEEATYLQGLNPRKNVVDECRPHVRMPRSIIAAQKILKKTYSSLSLVKPKDHNNYHVLSQEIVDLFGLGGGMYSGAKKLVVRGELKKSDGEVLGTFWASRASIGNFMLLGVQGTCSIFDKVNKKMGKDVAKWLKKPSQDALLGEPENAQEVKGLMVEGAWPRPQPQ